MTPSARPADTGRPEGRAIRIRPARADDVERIAAISFDETTHAETRALTRGDLDQARRYLRGQLDLEQFPSSVRPTVVATDHDVIVGMLQYSMGPARVHGRLENLRLLASVVGVIGLVRCIPQLVGRYRIDLPVPPNAFYVADMRVDAARRGHGIGGQLLEWAEHKARELAAPSMALTAMTTNPAIHLYQRHGFTITDVRTHPWYSRRLDGAGRCLMEKPLTPN